MLPRAALPDSRCAVGLGLKLYQDLSLAGCVCNMEKKIVLVGEIELVQNASE